MPSRLTACAAALSAVSALSWAGLAAPAHAQAPGGCVALEVHHLRVGQGPLMVAAYIDAASFGKVAMSQLQVNVTGETMTVPLCGLTGAAVAVTLFQDLNSNGKLDANPFGMPTEPWAASGRAAPMGPTWASAQVPLGSEPLVVKLSK